MLSAREQGIIKLRARQSSSTGFPLYSFFYNCLVMDYEVLGYINLTLLLLVKTKTKKKMEKKINLTLPCIFFYERWLLLVMIMRVFRIVSLFFPLILVYLFVLEYFQLLICKTPLLF